jgi:hypothetical protein
MDIPASSHWTQRIQFPLGQLASQTRIAALWIGVLIIGSSAAFGQMNTANISGLVTDSSRAIIPGATVMALNVATHRTYTSVTNEVGQFLLAQLPLADYTLTVNAQNFKEAVQEHVELHAGDQLRQDFSLEVGEQSEMVTVVGTEGSLQLESAETKDVIENQQVLALPLKDREFLQLALLSAGVVNPPGGTRGDSLQQTGKLINIDGQRAGHNLFLVDGVSVTDEYFNNVVLSPSPDFIQEFNIDKTNYSAEFGGKSGGVINVVTKSGTNSFHGSLYEFVRNNIFNAKNFFDPINQPSPRFQENQFGGSLGGPIANGRTFFFVNYEGGRIRDSLTHVFSVPTAAQRAGVFGATTITNPSTRQPFPGSTINVPLDPAAVALLARVPLANLPGTSNNLVSVAEQTSDNNQYNARLDHQFSTTDNAYIRASVFDANELDPFGSSVLNEALLPGFGRTLTTHSVNLSAGETHVFSPTVLNELRFGFLHVSGGQGDPNAGNTFASRYGLKGTTTNPADMGFPQVSLSNTFTTIGDAAGFTSRVDSNYEFSDNVTIHRGGHTTQFGGYFYHLSFNPSFPNDARGIYTYSGSYTGNALADFLLGYPSQAQVGIGEGAENAHTDWGHFYLQDGWQVNPGLKLTAGLRYEYNANLVAQSNQTSDIDLTAPGGPAFVVAGNLSSLSSTASALASLSPIRVVSAASVGWNNSLLTPQNLRLSPRVGVAWKIPGSHETVLRAGFGIYTNQAAYSILQNLAENVPFFLLKTVSNPSTAPIYMTENILAANPTGAIGANSVNHDFKIEYNEVWNLTFQRPITTNNALEVQYVGSRTVHADSSTALNVPLPGGARPYPELGAFTTIRWDGWATFNALIVQVTHRLSRHLSFDADYTWSKAMDDASDTGTTNAEYNLPQNVYNLAPEKGLSSFDHRHRLTANVVYDLPFARDSHGWLQRVVGNWRASGILTIQSGAPFTVNLSSAAGNDVAQIGLVSGNNIERPNLIGDPNNGPQTPAEWFNTSAFALPGPLTFGSAGRNIVIGPGFENIDLSLQKEGALSEKLKWQFRADVFNVLNHPNFDLPGRIFGASNFGVVSSAEDPREFQFALKLMF